jgi:hypothetical protein
MQRAISRRDLTMRRNVVTGSVAKSVVLVALAAMFLPSLAGAEPQAKCWECIFSSCQQAHVGHQGHTGCSTTTYCGFACISYCSLSGPQCEGVCVDVGSCGPEEITSITPNGEPLEAFGVTDQGDRCPRLPAIAKS